MTAAYVARAHSGTAPTAHLTGNINASDLTFTVDNGAGYPDGADGRPFVITFDAGKSTEEKALCTSRATNVFTVDPAGRGWDGTAAQSHTSGTGTVDETWSSTEADEASQTAAQTLGAISAKGDLLSGNTTNKLVKTAVGTNGQAVVADSSQPGGIKWAAPAPAVHDHSSPAAGGGIPESSVTGLLPDLAARLLKAGDTMTGALVLNADPAAALGAATKQYVDAETTARTAADSAESAARTAADALLLPKASGTATDLTVRPAVAADKGLIVEAQATQVGNLTEWQDSTAAALATVDKAGNAKFPNLPYAMAAGTKDFVFGGGNSLQQTISLPASRFSQAPIVTATISPSPAGSRPVTVRITSISATQFDAIVNSVDSSAMTGTWTVQWQAIQMLSGSAAG